MSEFLKELYTLCEKASIPLTDEAAKKMEIYYSLMVETNKQYNITAITQPKEAALKHFFDSIVPIGEIKQGARVIDIGSGGGFPIAPLKMMRGDITAAAVESSAKKCAFMNMAAAAAGAEINVLNKRAEELCKGAERAKWDVCVSRAVAALPVLIEICAPFVKKGGMFLAYKGEYETELGASKQAMLTIGLKLKKVIPMPCEEYSHHILVFEKTASTPEKYPRGFSQISKKPL